MIKCIFLILKALNQMFVCIFPSQNYCGLVKKAQKPTRILLNNAQTVQ